MLRPFSVNACVLPGFTLMPWSTCPLWCAWVALNPAPGEEERIIEAQISAQTFDQQGFKEGETLVVNPRKARVFVADAQAA